MAWVDWTTTSAGGNVQLQISGGYANISRSGNTVSGNLGLRFQFSGEWSSNSIAGSYNGSKCYAQNRTGGTGSYLTSKWTPMYCKANQSNGYNTSETYPWSFSTTVSGRGGGSIAITMSAGWTDWAGSTPYTYTFYVPYSALPDPSFNLNILNPDGTEPWDTGAAGSVEQSVNNGSYTRVINESASSYSVNTILRYRNFTPGTGKHLSSVSGLSPNDIYGPWSITLTDDATVKFQTAWDQYTITYNGNGGVARGIADQTKTYNVSLNLRTQIPTRNNHEFLGWSKNPNATTATWGAGDSFTENGANHGDVITLYAIWKPLYYDFNLKILTPEGVESKNATTLGSVKMSVNNGSYTTVVDEPNPQYLYTSTFKFKDVKLAPGLRLSSVTGATWDSANQVYTTTQPAEAKVVTFQTAYKGSKVKVNNNWKSGNVYVKVNGSWVAAKTVYIKRNGSWVEIPYKDINT